MSELRQQTNLKAAKLLYPTYETEPDHSLDGVDVRLYENGQVVSSYYIDIYTDTDALCATVDALINNMKYMSNGMLDIEEFRSDMANGVNQAMTKFLEETL